jgi:Domain of unknown function (DUF4177)
MWDMTRWEYRYVNLDAGAIERDAAFRRFEAEVRAAGGEGWEAVGEVDVTHLNHVGHTFNIRVLMFKRPEP